MINPPIRAVILRQDRRQRGGGHERIEEMPEPVGLLVFSGRIVRMAQPDHEDDPGLLTKPLHRHGDGGGGPAGDHDRAVLLDHRLGGGAGGVRLGLGVPRHKGDLLAEHAVTLQLAGGEGVEHAAIPLPVQMLDRKTKRTQLIHALIGVRPRLRDIEAEGDRAALRFIQISRTRLAAENGRRRQPCAKRDAAFQKPTTIEHILRHKPSPV